MPKISIIVAVYKAENYLIRCLDSILSQTFTDFELILINDGSPDNSGVICDEYSQKDKRINVIHKKNGGVASARQCGINNAKGEYTIHIDPDDWIAPDMLMDLYNKAIEENADIVICDFWVSINNNNTYRKQQPHNTKAENVLQDLLQHKLHGTLCNKLIKLSCYTKHDITFTEGLNTSEDFLVCVKILINNPRITYLSKAYYYYCYDNNNSITHQYNLETYKSHNLLLHELSKTLNGKYKEELCKQEVAIAILCMEHAILTPDEYKKIYITKYKKLLHHIKSIKIKILFTLSVYGFQNIACTFLRIEKNTKKTLKKIYHSIKKRATFYNEN